MKKIAMLEMFRFVVKAFCLPMSFSEGVSSVLRVCLFGIVSTPAVGLWKETIIHKWTLLVSVFNVDLPCVERAKYLPVSHPAQRIEGLFCTFYLHKILLPLILHSPSELLTSLIM